uniref:CCHC-type domain-containing protein n=1 Tax=Ananas comosus var. bracteatus TaxID=296719 RepID=A0A6V7Q7F9_ANACO|nr:unnamed protein product [Ananas comosus var. bracteatus]
MVRELGPALSSPHGRRATAARQVGSEDRRHPPPQRRGCHLVSANKKGKEKVGDWHTEKTTGKKKGDLAFTNLGRKKTATREKHAASTSSTSPSTDLAACSLHGRTQRRTSVKEHRVNEDTYSASFKKVMWADEGGLALTHITLFHPEDPTPTTRSSDTSTHDDRRRSDTGYGKSKPFFTSGIKKTYKEALLTPISTPTRHPRCPQSAKSFPTFSTTGKTSFRGRCYRCLGTNHWASSCCGPLRCVRCFKAGHIARSCMDRLPMAVYRAMRARPSYLSAFVPRTDDFHTRQNRCHNAILVDVLPPKRLGHFPHETIANRLASRFRGFPSDFHVAKHRQREFVIFLPEWVPADQLIRREILSLEDLRLQCFSWNPYFGLRRASLTYNLWIRLVCLPYECWSSRTVAALVGGFGCFIRADDYSIRMVDLTGYRCLIFVTHLSDIPENLEITLGDYSLSVLIQLERWGRRDVAIPGNPPNERMDQHDPLRRVATSPDRSPRRILSHASADSLQRLEVDTTKKGPAIIGRRGATDRNSNFFDAAVALNALPDVEGAVASRGAVASLRQGPIYFSLSLSNLNLSLSTNSGPYRYFPHLGPTGSPLLPGLTVGGVDPEPDPDEKLVDACYGAAGRDDAQGPIFISTPAIFRSPLRASPQGTSSFSISHFGDIPQGPFLSSTSTSFDTGSFGADHSYEADTLPGLKVGGVYPTTYASSFCSSPRPGVGNNIPPPPTAPLSGEDATSLPGGEEASPCDVKGSIRSSVRLNSARKVPALERAKLRKAFLLEGQTSGSECNGSD